MGTRRSQRYRLFLGIGWLVRVVVCLHPVVGHSQTNPRFPHAADPNYERTYQAYRAEMANRPIVAPALGYDGSSNQEAKPTTNSPGQGGLSGAFSSLGQSIKQSWNKLGELLTPKEKVEKAPEPTSVFNPARPSPETYVAMARFCMENGRLGEAEQNYLSALRANPRHLGALLGYAKLQEQLGQPSEAMQIYQRLLSLYPQEPSVFNNAGLCYARNGQLETAARLLHQAVQLEPKKPLYRNNLAMVLVDMGRPELALGHLRAVYPEAVARYNLGQLLLHKGEWEAAAEQFAAALEADPTMQAAQAWLEELARRKTPGPLAPQAEVARRPQLVRLRQPAAPWSEITDLPSPAHPGQPSRFPLFSNKPPWQNHASDPTSRMPPPMGLDHPRIYARPGGTFSAQPPDTTLPPGEEDLALLPSVPTPHR